MRVFDVFFALAGLLFFSPILLALSLFIKLSSPGPVIYLQKRVGLHGEIFNLYKFRSMIVNADKMGTSITASNDPRITKIGSFLRKTKIDELPQLWNVLKGDMSFVGPRPDVPEIVDNYTPEMMKILNVRPGITSIATLQLRNEEDILSSAKETDKAYEEILVPAKVKLAMKHVEKNSLHFNLSVLLKTVWALTFGKLMPSKESLFVKQIKSDIERLNN